MNSLSRGSTLEFNGLEYPLSPLQVSYSFQAFYQRPNTLFIFKVSRSVGTGFSTVLSTLLNTAKEFEFQSHLGLLKFPVAKIDLKGLVAFIDKVYVPYSSLWIEKSAQWDNGRFRRYHTITAFKPKISVYGP